MEDIEKIQLKHIPETWDEIEVKGDPQKTIEKLNKILKDMLSNCKKCYPSYIDGSKVNFFGDIFSRHCILSDTYFDQSTIGLPEYKFVKKNWENLSKNIPKNILDITLKETYSSDQDYKDDIYQLFSGMRDRGGLDFLQRGLLKGLILMFIFRCLMYDVIKNKQGEMKNKEEQKLTLKNEYFIGEDKLKEGINPIEIEKKIKAYNSTLWEEVFGEYKKRCLPGIESSFEIEAIRESAEKKGTTWRRMHWFFNLLSCILLVGIIWGICDKYKLNQEIKTINDKWEKEKKKIKAIEAKVKENGKSTLKKQQQEEKKLPKFSIASKKNKVYPVNQSIQSSNKQKANKPQEMFVEDYEEGTQKKNSQILDINKINRGKQKGGRIQRTANSGNGGESFNSNN